MAKEAIKEWTGKIIGYIETLPNGDKKVTDWRGIILGYYKKAQNVTTDFYGHILYRGDMSASLIK